MVARLIVILTLLAFVAVRAHWSVTVTLAWLLIEREIVYGIERKLAAKMEEW